MSDFLKSLMKNKEREEYVTAPEPVDQIDWNQIGEFEGGSKEAGYVPKSGKSGVTIGAGLDLGQRSHMQDLDIAPEIKAKLEPFLGAKREDAERRLAQSPLVVSPEEAKQISEATQKNTADKLRSQWEKSSNIPFDDLSPAQQTILASVMHQYGNLDRTPSFKSKAVSGEWDKVLKELRNFKDAYPSRRNREADILEQELAKYKKLAIK